MYREHADLAAICATIPQPPAATGGPVRQHALQASLASCARVVGRGHLSARQCEALGLELAEERARRAADRGDKIIAVVGLVLTVAVLGIWGGVDHATERQAAAVTKVAAK